MAQLLIRNLEPAVKERLRLLGAQHGHSMEEEARAILKQAVGGVTGSALLELSRQLFGGDNGIEIALPSREDRPGPSFLND